MEYTYIKCMTFLCFFGRKEMIKKNPAANAKLLWDPKKIREALEDNEI